MSFVPVSTSDEEVFKGKTLIIPSVSLGNVPQLAADLLITSLSLERVGYIGDGTTVLPLIGPFSLPSSSGSSGSMGGSSLATGGLEVYADPKRSVIVVQQRSPTLKDKKDEHVKLLSDFAAGHGFTSVLVLTSLDAANQDDASLSTPHLSILPPSPAQTPLLKSIASIPSLPNQETYPPFIPGGGLARRILRSLHDSSPSLPQAGVGAWCVEGDNRGDARALASLVLHLLEIDNVQLTEPKEWQGLFGATEGWSGGAGANAEIYG